MEKIVNVKIEDAIAMFIIACGEFNGVQFEYYPNIPSCFGENINFQSSCGCNADFLRLTINNLLGVECWFADEDGDTFFYSLNDIKKSHPILWTAIVTHIYDMIENFEDC